VKFSERLRRWWKPAKYGDEHPAGEGEGHPLSAEEREEEKPVTFQEERGTLGGYTAGGEPPDPERELRPPG
jgi:hypothetical protein